MSITRISKKEVIKKQLETAISLYFFDKDKISTHTLTCAAHEILRDLYKLKGKDSLMADQILGLIKPERHREARDQLNEAKNFFKHLQNPKKELKIDFDITVFWLWDACLMYKTLYKKQTKDMEIFVVWFNISNKDLLENPKQIKKAESIYNKFKSKTKFYETIKKII